MMMMMVVVVVLLMIVWSECFILVSFFVCLCPQGKSSSYYWNILVFFSSVLSARTTLDIGYYRNMAGSWGKVLAKPCRVRTDSSIHSCAMFGGGS